MSDLKNKEPQKKNGASRIQRIVAAILTALFIPMIFAFGAYGLVSNPSELVDSLRFSHAKSYLSDIEDGAKFFPMLKARIQSLQSALGDTIPLRDELGYLNASFQYALGKDMISMGGEQLLSLPGGQIYQMTTRTTFEAEAREVVGLYEQLDGRVPFLFAYINPQFYNGSITLPAGYDVIDTSDELADQVLEIVRSAGIDALDSREFFEGLDYSDNELILRTDMHWTTLAALLATPIYADEINRLTGAHLDTDKIALDQFETEVYPDLFLGEYGQQVGQCNSGLDDITFYLPKYPTEFTRYSVERDGTEEHASGDFREAVVKWDALDREPDGTNIRGYVGYGLVERIEEIENLSDDCEDLTILIFRDSYTAPVGSFLSLMAKKVVMVDMRTMDMTAMEVVDQYDPDIVIVSLSRPMFEDHRYDLGTGYEQYAAEVAAREDA